jgi:sialate O-acetylesterase
MREAEKAIRLTIAADAQGVIGGKAHKRERNDVRIYMLNSQVPQWKHARLPATHRPLRGLCLCWVALSLIVMLAGIPVPAQAQDRLAHIFQDNMVLQRDKPAPVWGWAKPGAQVEVAFAGQKKQATADANGYWKAVLDPLTASREGRSLDVKIGDTALTRKNVLVGEVWIAAGQSNMNSGGPDLDSGVYPHHVSPVNKNGNAEIRHIRFGWGASLEPLADVDPAGRSEASWQLRKEDTPPPSAPWYSHPNLADYFARVVRDGLDVPVGIIHVAVSGSAQAPWMAKETLEGFPPTPGRQGSNYYQSYLSNHEEQFAKKAGISWETFKQAEDTWRETKKGPWPGVNLVVPNYPTVLYNTRIYPLAPLAIRGAIWLQGEGGADGPYGDRLVAMVKQWRGLFGQDFHFVWGTLPRFTHASPPLVPLCDPDYSANREIRRAIKVFGDAGNVALVELNDLGDDNGHWFMKNEAGRRMGLAALTVTYGQNHIYTCPRMVESKIEGGKAVVRFEFAGDGLVYQPSVDGISGVYLRGKTGPGRWGQVKIIGKDSIEVSHPDIAVLETVAYAQNSNPHETLFSGAGLPASPFVVNSVVGAIWAGHAAASAPPQLLTLQDATTGAIMNIAHVRRSGYVFQPRSKDNKALSAPAAMLAYIPAEWKGFEVEAAGKPLEVKETTKDGRKFVTFNAPGDGSWIIVAETGKAAEFRKINRF